MCTVGDDEGLSFMRKPVKIWLNRKLCWKHAKILSQDFGRSIGDILSLLY